MGKPGLSRRPISRVPLPEENHLLEESRIDKFPRGHRLGEPSFKFGQLHIVPFALEPFPVPQSWSPLDLGRRNLCIPLGNSPVEYTHGRTTHLMRALETSVFMPRRNALSFLF